MQEGTNRSFHERVQCPMFGHSHVLKGYHSQGCAKKLVFPKSWSYCHKPGRQLERLKRTCLLSKPTKRGTRPTTENVKRGIFVLQSFVRKQGLTLSNMHEKPTNKCFTLSLSESLCPDQSQGSTSGESFSCQSFNQMDEGDKLYWPTRQSRGPSADESLTT